ncbi:hypothetical protein KIN20_037502 [Parelaphostrongylus tenuis]|uniref:Uncharacterized protein n=1 Tax=Parelaphostrongylus tenuis TaxID=148309 RepID=A0AAD5REK3_PARTN|nr:hypothetical protein KIN20_037502 [Parelaphostrongylus tenuis]
MSVVLYTSPVSLHGYASIAESTSCALTHNGVDQTDRSLLNGYLESNGDVLLREKGLKIIAYSQRYTPFEWLEKTIAVVY